MPERDTVVDFAVSPSSNVPAKTFSVALLGNPNVGKTSLFNVLTGARQHVGNWPGVTVEQRVGVMYHQEKTFRIIDLPGTYTIGAKSLDEKVARDYLLYESPDIVVVVADALNLEKSLYLLLQVLELRGNVVLAINSVDEAKARGIHIDRDELSKHLGIPVVLTSAVTGEGVEQLKSLLARTSKTSIHVHYMFSPEIEKEIADLSARVSANRDLINFDSRWFSIKLLENDEELKRLIGEDLIVSDRRLEIASVRYDYIRHVLEDAYKHSKVDGWDASTAIDHVLTHKYLGILIFFSVMYMIFQLTFTVSEPFTLLIERGVDGLAGMVENTIGIDWLESLPADGIIQGVGAVLIFVPNIFILFLCLGILEETGYLPRAAFVIDRIMYSLKLSGRSFISMLLGFGCNVSSIMSTRSINEPQERLVTMLVSPFISCSARLPIYIMIAGTFFAANAGLVVFSLYILSIVFTAVSALIINRFMFKGKPSPMIMELPRYRSPRLKSLGIYTWNMGKHFLEKAGTIIFVASIMIWVLYYLPGGGIQNSYASAIGRVLEPIFRPLGFTWQMVTSLLFGVAAKEVIVSSMNTLYLAGGTAGSIALTPGLVGISGATAYAFLVFVLLYIPCAATIAAIKNESGSWRYGILSIVYSFGLAYVVALIFNLIGGIL